MRLSSLTAEQINALYAKEKEKEAAEVKARADYDRRSTDTKGILTGMVRKGATEASMGLLNLNKHLREGNEQFKRDHPVASTIAGVVGTVPTLLTGAGGIARVLTRAGVKGLAKRAAMEGAIYGTADKAAHNIGNRRPVGEGVATAAAGGGIAGSLGGVVAKTAQKVIPKVLQGSAVRTISDKLGLGGLRNKASRLAGAEGRREGFNNFVKQLDKGSTGIKSGTLLDTGSAHNKAFADSLAHGDTKARQIAFNRLGREAQANPARADKILDKNLGRRSFERSATRSEGIADKAYQQAYKTNNIKLPESLQNRKVADRAAKGVEGMFGKEAPRGSLKFHDYQKRALDKVGESKGVASHIRMEARDAAMKLRDALSAQSPTYKTALGQSKKAFDIRGAAEVGQKYNKHSVAELTDKFKGSSAAEKHAFAQGAKKNIRENIFDSSKGSNVMAKLADARTGGRLESVIGKKRVGNITSAAQPYAHRFEALSGVKSGSKTAEHQANSGIFRTIGQGLRSPTRLGFRMADKGMNAIRTKQPDATSMRYILNAKKLNKALKIVGKNKKHARGIGAGAYKYQEE
jgi:hypothetical protein